MAFNRPRTLDKSILRDSVSEEDYNDRMLRMRQMEANAYQNSQQRQQGMVGSATRQMGDSLEKSTRNFVDSFGKGQAGASGMFQNRQAGRDELRDQARFDTEFRDQGNIDYHRSDMAPAARQSLERSGYQYRQPTEQAPPQDMTTLEGRGQYFQDTPQRPDYTQQEGFPEQGGQEMARPPLPPQRDFSEGNSREMVGPPANLKPAPAMQPRGFPMTGPDTGYSTPDRSYSPGAADVLDGKARPGFNPGTTVDSPYSNVPQAQLPPLTEEEMAAEQLKKKDDIPGTVGGEQGRWGKGLGDQSLTPEEQAAVNESWRLEDERLAQEHEARQAETSPVGSYPQLKKEYYARLARLASQEPVDRLRADSGASANLGSTFNVLQASHYAKLMQEPERLRGMQLDNVNKMYGPPMSEADVLSAQDRAIRTEADMELKDRDLQLKELELEIKREQARAAKEGYKFTGKVSRETGTMIYVDPYGVEKIGQVVVQPEKKAGTQRRKVGQTADGRIIYDDPELGEVVGDTAGVLPPDRLAPDMKVLPTEPGEVPHWIDPKNPAAGAQPIPGAPKKPLPKPSATAQKAYRDAKKGIQDNLTMAKQVEAEIAEWEKIKAQALSYNKNTKGPGTGLAGGALAKVPGQHAIQDLERLFKRGSFKMLMEKADGKSRLFDTKAEQDFFKAWQPNVNMDGPLLEKAIQDGIDTLKRMQRGYQEQAEYLKAETTDLGRELGGEAPEETKTVNGVTYRKVPGGWEEVK